MHSELKKLSSGLHNRILWSETFKMDASDKISHSNVFVSMCQNTADWAIIQETLRWTICLHQAIDAETYSTYENILMCLSRFVQQCTMC